MTRISEIRQLTWARVLHFCREPEAIFWVFVFPVILAMVLGVAFQHLGTETVRVGVLAGEGSTRYVSWFRQGVAIDVVELESYEEAELSLRTGGVAAWVEASTPALLHYDPSRPEGASAYMRIMDAIQRGAGRQDVVEVAVEEVTTRGSRYIDWLIPGLLGMNLMGTGIWGIGFAIVHSRQHKLLRRFLVTPMRKSSYLLSFLLSRLIFLTVEVAVLLLFAGLVMGVPFYGSFLVLGLLCLLGALSFAGLGLLISSRARTIEGVSGLMNFIMMPMWLCSGVFFSYERFPDALQPLARALPLTALNDALRANMMEGAGLLTVGPEILIQCAWGLVTFLVALRIFRWQ
ncbi:MAG: ABC transporter permease [Planctomycetota bacterium]